MQLFQEETIGREGVSETENGVRHRSQSIILFLGVPSTSPMKRPGGDKP